MSFSQKSDEQVVAVQLGCGRMCSLLKNVPISVYDCVGEYLAQKREREGEREKKKSKIKSSPIFGTSAPANECSSL